MGDIFLEFGFWRKEISSKVGLDCYSCSGCGCEIFCDVGRKPNICICPNCDLDMVNSNVKVIKCRAVPKKVVCKDCEYLMFSDCYGECSKAYKGIVSPNDSCGKGKLRASKTL